MGSINFGWAVVAAIFGILLLAGWHAFWENHKSKELLKHNGIKLREENT